ncbi:MAG: DnaJ domain-containing protein [Syntrophobacteraceae bacterium]
METRAKVRNKICCYKILGISVRATQNEIRSAFRYLAMKLHPDRNPGNPVAAERFREVRRAYETLKDPTSRGKYDRLRGYRKSRRNADSSWTDIYSEGGEASSFDEIFQDLFGIGRREVRTSRICDLRFDLQVARGALLNGGFHEEISYVRTVFCRNCNNGGRRSGCELCGGAGEREESCSLRVWIPAEVADGTRIRVAAAGDFLFPALSPGDLILLVQIVEGC